MSAPFIHPKFLPLCSHHLHLLRLQMGEPSQSLDPTGAITTLALGLPDGVQVGSERRWSARWHLRENRVLGSA